LKIEIMKRTIAVSALGVAILLGSGQATNAQRNRNDENRQRQADKKERKAWEKRVKNEDKLIRSYQRQEQNRINRMRRVRADSENNRYRINRDGNYYETDNRGAEFLRQAVNYGYQEGYRTGRDDRKSGRSDNYNGSLIYRRANYGYRNYVSSDQYQYYFQQGFQRGYEDGFNSRYQYGANNNGSLNIFGTILDGILNIQRY